MYNLVIFFHIVTALALIGVILIQRGRSGGLVEALGGVESIFGTKTNSFFVKTTVALAVLFFVTSITLAYLSREKGRSLTEKYPAVKAPAQETTSTTKQSPAVKKEVPAAESSGAITEDSLPQNAQE